MRPLPALTGLRFFAALAVVFVHFGAPFLDAVNAPGWARQIARDGYMGVNLFFILSGFILAYNYLTPTGMRGTVAAFVRARAARILPVYFLALLVSIPVFAWQVEQGAFLSFPMDPLVTLGVNLALVQAWVPHAANFLNAPGWSLSAEVVFYLAFPLLVPLVLRIPPRFLMPALLAAWALALLPSVLYLLVLPDAKITNPGWGSYGTWLQVVKFNPLVRLPEFAFGVLLGRVFLLNPTWRLSVSPSLLLVLVLAVTLLVITRVPTPFVLRHGGLLDPLFGAVVLLTAYATGRVARVLGSPAMRLLGEASFATYLLHVPVWDGLQALTGMSVAALPAWGFVVYLALTVVLSVLVLWIFEEPARKVLRHGRPRHVVVAG